MSGSERDDNDHGPPPGNPWAEARPRREVLKTPDRTSDGGDAGASTQSKEQSTQPSAPESADKARSTKPSSRPLDRIERRRGRSKGSPKSPGRGTEGGYDRPAKPSLGDQLVRERGSLESLSAALIREIQTRLQRHPSGSLVRNRRETVQVTLEVPIARGKDRLDRFAKGLHTALDAAVLSLVSEREVAESGAAFCLRCGRVGCEHALPTPQQVFVGYGATGMPLWEDYGQALLNLSDPGMAQLFGGSGQVVTRLWNEAELTHQLLPAFKDTDSGYRLLGQVTAGWFWVPTGYLEETTTKIDHPRNFALSFQIGLIKVDGQPGRLTLNTIGKSPAEGPLEDLHDAFGDLPWEDARRWCRLALADVERSLRRASQPKKRSKGKKAARPADGLWHDRVLRILAGFERRLVRRERASRRKTRHAENRRKQKRPTGHALADLAAAADEAVLRDTRNGTFVVLGERGRTHIFNQSGRLVTSIVYASEAVEKRRKKGFWVAAEEADVGGLREAVRGAQT